MGDKSQLLAMTFATKYKLKIVIPGVFLGILLNHGIAVLVGNYISRFIPINYLSFLACKNRRGGTRGRSVSQKQRADSYDSHNIFLRRIRR